MIVLFPQPDGPTKANIWPPLISTEKLFRTLTFLNHEAEVHRVLDVWERILYLHYLIAYFWSRFISEFEIFKREIAINVVGWCCSVR